MTVLNQQGAGRTDCDIVISASSPTDLQGSVSSLRAIGGRRKRLIDFVCACAIFAALLPLFTLVSIAIRASSKGPIFYGHTRIGHGGRPFKCWKFRTMHVNGDEILQRHLEAYPAARAEWAAYRKLQRDPRVTPIGKILREYSVDELPQLLNVMCGEMSLVGPRPVVAQELSEYGSVVNHYLAARPGITGLWQVSGRSSVSSERRVQMDAAYVAGWSLRQDALILVKTVPAVVFARGAY